MFAVPFLNWSTGTKAGAVTALIVLGEVTFWVGGLLLGREVVKKYRQYLSPGYWLRAKRGGEADRTDSAEADRTDGAGEKERGGDA